MSVHHESLDMVRPAERKEDPPALEYNTVRNESLTMFGAALGGAILGASLALLILAILNGGTLNFSAVERLALLEASMQRIDENVGAVSYNVDVVAGQARTIQNQIATVESSLREQLNSSTVDINSLESAVDMLSHTSTQFTSFLQALNEALDGLEGEGTASAQE
jgi:hypothetical protein